MTSDIKIKLHTSKEEYGVLIETLKHFNSLCNYISEESFNLGKIKNKTKLQKTVYEKTRKNNSDASSQVVIRAISRVADSYKISIESIKKANAIRVKKGLPLIVEKPNHFKPISSMDYDCRIMKFHGNKISLLTTKGRIKLEYFIPKYFQDKFKKFTMAKLIHKDGTFWLHLTVEELESEIQQYTRLLGIDQGQVFLVSDSDGEQYEGKTLKKITEKYKNRRESLQKSKKEKKTRSKIRAWNRINKKEGRYRTDINHQISKRIVQKAKDTKSVIVLENLTDFFDSVKVRRENRFQRRSWSFFQLMFFIQYKALRLGIKVITVNPAYTSQECFVCGFISEKNRKSQSEFLCVNCGHYDNADINAAKVISLRGRCQLPYSSSMKVELNKPTTLVVGN